MPQWASADNARERGLRADAYRYSSWRGRTLTAYSLPETAGGAIVRGVARVDAWLRKGLSGVPSPSHDRRLPPSHPALSTDSSY